MFVILKGKTFQKIFTNGLQIFQLFCSLSCCQCSILARVLTSKSSLLYFAFRSSISLFKRSLFLFNSATESICPSKTWNLLDLLFNAWFFLSFVFLNSLLTASAILRRDLWISFPITGSSLIAKQRPGTENCRRSVYVYVTGDSSWITYVEGPWLAEVGFPFWGGRNRIGRREKWPKKVGRREKSGRKCREEGEIGEKM